MTALEVCTPRGWFSVQHFTWWLKRGEKSDLFHSNSNFRGSFEACDPEYGFGDLGGQ